jgi:hypothetical protein
MIRIQIRSSFAQFTGKMKNKHIVLSIGLISLLSLSIGCKAKSPAANTGASPAASATTNTSSNSNRPSDASSSAANANHDKAGATPAPEQTTGPPKLIGTYEAREVEDKGVVTMLSQIKTVIVFTADGSYSRASQKEGRIYHRDSGQFHIEGPDNLVLSIQVSDKNIKSPPLTKTHKFSLSSDGDELKLISEKGAIATYRRTAKPKA